MRVNSRKAAREALTGAQVGRVLSREMYVNQSVDAVGSSGRQHRWIRECEHPSDSARSETPACLETSRTRTGRPLERLGPKGNEAGPRRRKAARRTRTLWRSRTAP